MTKERVESPSFESSDVEGENKLAGKVVLLTGASRGIGASTALLLAREGAIVIGPHRDPNQEKRANMVLSKVAEFGGQMAAPVCDIANGESRYTLIDQIKNTFGKVDVIIHNAAGGLEDWATSEYQLELNAIAKEELTRGLFEILSDNAVVLDISSLWSHYFGTGIEGLPAYDPIAATKKEGTRRLRTLIPVLNQQYGKNVRLGEVCAHAVEGTATVAGFKMRFREGIKRLEKTAEGGRLPTIDEVARKVVEVVKSDFSREALEFVGVPNLSREQIAEQLSMYGDNVLFVERLVIIGENHAIGYTMIDHRFQNPIFATEDLGVDTKINARLTKGHFKEEVGISLFPGYKQVALMAAKTAGGITNKSLLQAKGVQFRTPLFPGDTLSVYSDVQHLGDVVARVQTRLEAKESEVAKTSSMIFHPGDGKDNDLRARLIEVAGQTLGLVFPLNQGDTSEPSFPLFNGIEKCDFFDLRPHGFESFDGKMLETEAKITSFDERGFKGDVTVRIDDITIATFEGLECGIVPTRVIPRVLSRMRVRGNLT